MFYKEFLRVRNFFVVFALVMMAIGLVVLLFSGHGKVSIGDDTPPSAQAVNAATADKFGPGPSQVHGTGIVISNEPNEPFPISALLAFAGLVAAIFATGIGCGLACENNGHLEIAWTRPASRVGYAARLMAVDIAGILAIFAFTVLLCLGVIYAVGLQHYLALDPKVGAVLARFLVYPLAWYGIVCGLTASVRGRAGAIAGFSWLGAAILLALLDLKMPPVLHAIVKTLNYVNPLLYGNFASGDEASRHIVQIGLPISIAALGAIAVVGIAAALTQWRALEA
ncbi:MAG: hypothetical protein JOZ50_13000 [Candidatus Eremiobacteraeota bacterium]|nr:hypothetical protein [Candidatus Eremiobacteraeota bacterium]